eukprot:12681050-Ditylum_brightwellii.AAC.3
MLTRRKYEQAVKARKLYAMEGRPSVADFKNMVKMNLLPGSPVSLQDVNNIKFLFGTDVGSLKGETTRKVPELATSNYIVVPREIIDLHKDITIVSDAMYINKMLFLTSISKKIKLTTAQKLNDRKNCPL